MIGLKRNSVKLHPYTQEWKQAFSDEKKKLGKALGEKLIDVQHIGSTSIPGCLAKPIIDIIAAVKSQNDGLSIIQPLESLDYEYHGEMGIPGRFYFVKRERKLSLFHLHVYTFNSENWTNHLIFRDYLLKHPEDVEKYSRLKVDLLDRYKGDRKKSNEI